jgi:hypothetical protein
VSKALDCFASLAMTVKDKAVVPASERLRREVLLMKSAGLDS